MNNQRKERRIIKLELEVRVKDKIIAQLIKILADNKCKVPKQLTDMIASLYNYKMPSNSKKFKHFIMNKFKKKKK